MAVFDATNGAPIAVDARGNLFVAATKSNNVFRVAPGGRATAVLDAGRAGGSFAAPVAVAADVAGNAYVAALVSDNVFRIEPGGTVTEILDPSRAPAALNGPNGVAVDSSGNVFVCAFGSDNAFRVAPDGTVTEIIDASGDGTTALADPTHIAADLSGNVYVASQGTSSLFRIAPGGAITRVLDVSGDGSTPFGLPAGLAVDASGNVYASSLNGVFRVGPDGSVLEIYHAAVPRDGAYLRGRPAGIAVDSAANVYVAAEGNNLFRVDPAGGIVRMATLAGDGGHTFQGASAVAAAPGGDVFVSALRSHNVFLVCADEDGDALCSSWETRGIDGDGDGVVDLDLPNLVEPGVGTNPRHKDILLEIDWSRGYEPRQSAVRALKTAFAFAPADAGGTVNPDGTAGIKIWVDTGSLVVTQVSEDGAGPGTCSDGIDNSNERGGQPPDGSCSNGLDDDGDGFTDLMDRDCEGGDQADPECAGIEDGVAVGTCADGVDNRNDGFVDSADPDCANSAFEDGAYVGTCGDGLDNGSGTPLEDGLADLDDPDCLVGDDLSRECSDPSRCGPGSCRDGIDNDPPDGAVDLADPDCRKTGGELFNPVANELGGVPDGTCSDGADDDGDGLTDAADPNCFYADPANVALNSVFYVLKHGAETPPTEDGAMPGSCLDGVDNASEQLGLPPDGTCGNGVDDDGDGATDAADPQCDGKDGLDTDCTPNVEDGAAPGSCGDAVDNASEFAGRPADATCSNGIDDDGDGSTDALDPECDGMDGRDPDCTTTCFDGVDNDPVPDGLVDARDPNCSAGGNFDSDARRLVFHYATHARGFGGTGEGLGNDFTEGNHDGCTLLHELGHNLKLFHGGSDSVNLKPNYVSNMNYSQDGCIFQRNAPLCDPRMIDYSPVRLGGTEDDSSGYDVCYDGVDNDADGAIDAADPDCLPTVRAGIAEVQRASAPLAALSELAVTENTLVLDATDPTKLTLFWDTQGNQVMWPVDGDGDGDGTPDLVDLDGDMNAGSGGSLASVDFNRDGQCVCAPDGITPMPVGDDFPRGNLIASGCMGPTIESGPDRTCQTAAGPGDRQVTPVGITQPSPLAGYDDWRNLVFDFRQKDDFPGQPNFAAGVVDDEDYLRDREEVLEAIGMTDLSIVKEAEPGALEVGEELLYTLRIRNRGPNPASGARVSDWLPSGVAYRRDSGACREDDAGALVCDLHELGIGEVREITIAVGTEGACVGGRPVPLINTARVVKLAGSDSNPGNDEAALAVTPEDTTPPRIERVTVTPTVLWPPNHRFASVELDVVATDTCDPDPRCRVVRVESNEPVAGPGHRDESPDWRVEDDLRLSLRAERLGKGSGRVYTITVECADASGNRSPGRATVSVPHASRAR